MSQAKLVLRQTCTLQAGHRVATSTGEYRGSEGPKVSFPLRRMELVVMEGCLAMLPPMLAATLQAEEALKTRSHRTLSAEHRLGTMEDLLAAMLAVGRAATLAPCHQGRSQVIRRAWVATAATKHQQQVHRSSSPTLRANLA